MAREDVRELGRRLRHDDFDFLPPGEYSIDDIYRAVQQRYPELCDDEYRCSENCHGGHDQPEWFHAVRRAIDALDGKGRMSSTGRRGRHRVEIVMDATELN
jgi:hypothetical protein